MLSQHPFDLAAIPDLDPAQLPDHQLHRVIAALSHRLRREPFRDPTDTQNVLNMLDWAVASCERTPRINLDGADLSGMNLSGMNFAGASFRRANLRGVTAARTDFHGADFTQADMIEISANEANFRAANFYRANLSRANFAAADAARARLVETVAPSARFEHVDFQDAELSNLYALKAKFDESNLTGANLDGAHIDGATLEGTVASERGLRNAIGQWEGNLFGELAQDPHPSQTFAHYVLVEREWSPNLAVKYPSEAAATWAIEHSLFIDALCEEDCTDITTASHINTNEQAQWKEIYPPAPTRDLAPRPLTALPRIGDQTIQLPGTHRQPGRSGPGR